jgi:peptidylprolyl isomerase
MDRRRGPIGFTTTLGASLALLLTLLLAVPAAWAYLPQGNAVSDPTALLRNALPIEQGDLQKLQHRLEDTSDDLRAKRWTSLTGSVRRAESQLGSSRERILASFAPADRATAEALLTDAGTHLRRRLQVLARLGPGPDHPTLAGTPMSPSILVLRVLSTG